MQSGSDFQLADTGRVAAGKCRVLRRLALFAIALLAVASSLHAGPPLITDDPETPGRGGWEVNVSDQVFKTRDLLNVFAPYLDINYGPTDNSQLKLEFAAASFAMPEETDLTTDGHAGVGDLLPGYKYRFIDEKEAGFSMSIFPQVSIPTGNAPLGLGLGHPQLFAPFQISKHFCDEKLFVYAESGYTDVCDGGRGNFFYNGIAAQYKVSKKLELMAEVGDFTYPHGGGPDNPFFNVGGAYHCNDTVAVIGSAGRSFRNRASDAPEFQSFIGFQFTWGARKTRIRKTPTRMRPATRESGAGE